VGDVGSPDSRLRQVNQSEALGVPGEPGRERAWDNVSCNSDEHHCHASGFKLKLCRSCCGQLTVLKMPHAHNGSENRPEPALTENLLAILNDSHASAEARDSAATRLGNVHDARVVAALEEVLRACVPSVWRSAVGSLAVQGWKAGPGLERLLVALRNHDWDEIGPAEFDAIPSLPGSLVERLIYEDPGSAAKVIEILARHGWKPRAPGEIAVYHVLRGEWSKLAATGEACLDPLVEVAWADSEWFDDQTRAAAAQALRDVVAEISANLPERRLRYLMALPNPVRIQEEVGAEIKIPIYPWRAMCGCIEQELRRRGLWP
jgi:hypothetical protein